MLQTKVVDSIPFQLLPEPVEVQVKPEPARNLFKASSNSTVKVTVIGCAKKNRLVLLGGGDRLYVGHLVDPPEEWIK